MILDLDFDLDLDLISFWLDLDRKDLIATRSPRSIIRIGILKAHHDLAIMRLIRSSYEVLSILLELICRG